MKQLAELFASREDWLIRQVLDCAKRHGCTRHTPLPEESWRSSIAGLSAGLCHALVHYNPLPELDQDGDHVTDPVAVHGVAVVQRHRTGGGTLDMFFGLMKCCRQGCLDLLAREKLPAALRAAGNSFVERYFDRVELGLVGEWDRTTRERQLASDKLLEVGTRSRAEAEVQRLNAELARRVAQRTEELRAISEDNDRKLAELVLLHRVGSVLLTTVNLNKLVHLILTGLTAGPVPVFERAMLFLINERSGVLQGMLGVTREDAAGAAAHAEAFLAEGWSVTDEEMARQRDSAFSATVRDCRLELSRRRNVASQAVLEKRIIFVPDTARSKRVDREVVQRFDIGSFAVAPLLGKEQVFGVVVVDNPVSRRPIAADALRFLELFTNQAGVAIENSMLYMRLEDANRRLRDAQEQLIHGERLATIGEMSASIAHDLKGPLVAIGGFARRLGKGIAPASPEAAAAAMIVSEVQRLERMLGDILTYTKKTTICYDRCSIGDIIDDSLAIIMPILERCGITVARSLPRRPMSLYGDCQQLKQIFINLFSNAQEAMPNGGELRIAVAAATLSGKPAISVKVADSGEGIPLPLLNSIFHSFYTTKATGTGLGLPIANRIVTNHGGKIRVASQPGKGAEFTVLLPRQG
jgi:signal transduction histidine kinase